MLENETSDDNLTDYSTDLSFNETMIYTHDLDVLIAPGMLSKMSYVI